MIINDDHSHFDHPPLFFSSVPTDSLLRLIPFLFKEDILAFLAFAVFATLEACLVAFTVLLETVRLLAIATLNMLVILNFLPKRIRIPIH